MSARTSVWKREGEHTLSERVYATLICFWTVVGITACGAAATVSQHWQPTIWLMILPFVSAVVGTIIAGRSDNPVVSLIGYGMVAIPFGLMIGPVVNLYTTVSVVRTLFITAGMLVGLGIFGAVYPKSLASWGSWLFGALLILILGRFSTIILAAFGVQVNGAMRLWDWVSVGLFSAYVIFDMNRAMRIQRTADNAIDVALSIFMDAINLFLSLLGIQGDRK